MIIVNPTLEYVYAGVFGKQIHASISRLENLG